MLGPLLALSLRLLYLIGPGLTSEGHVPPRVLSCTLTASRLLISLLTSTQSIAEWTSNKPTKTFAITAMLLNS